MVKEDFKEITEEELKNAKILLESNGDCTEKHVPCIGCPFRFTNTEKYVCYDYEDEEFIELIEEFLKTFGDK